MAEVQNGGILFLGWANHFETSSRNLFEVEQDILHTKTYTEQN
jgi:hypothetical protein